MVKASAPCSAYSALTAVPPELTTSTGDMPMSLIQIVVIHRVSQYRSMLYLPGSGRPAAHDVEVGAPVCAHMHSLTVDEVGVVGKLF